MDQSIGILRPICDACQSPSLESSSSLSLASKQTNKSRGLFVNRTRLSFKGNFVSSSFPPRFSLNPIGKDAFRGVRKIAYLLTPSPIIPLTHSLAHLTMKMVRSFHCSHYQKYCIQFEKGFRRERVAKRVNWCSMSNSYTGSILALCVKPFSCSSNWSKV